MPTTRETILTALHARLQPLAAVTLRDEVLPERIPPGRVSKVVEILRRRPPSGLNSA